MNIKDCFAVPDADGDGKMEFVVKGFVVPTARIHAFIFEATGDNTYEIIKSFDLFGGDYNYYGGSSDVGDVDGDGIPEIVLEACQNVYIIKAAGNDSFYVWQTLPGNSSGSSVRVYDIDGNGLSEVIISGNNQTRIYEYQVGIAETAGAVVQPLTLETFPNPFKGTTNIRYSIQAPVIRIYDSAGRLVRSFYPGSSIENQESGLVWDGTDDSGRNMPGGVYLARLETPQGCLMKKLVKLK